MAYRFPYPKAASQKTLVKMLIKTIHAPAYAISHNGAGTFTAQPMSHGRARCALAWHA